MTLLLARASSLEGTRTGRSAPAPRGSSATPRPASSRAGSPACSCAVALTPPGTPPPWTASPSPRPGLSGAPGLRWIPFPLRHALPASPLRHDGVASPREASPCHRMDTAPRGTGHPVGGAPGRRRPRRRTTPRFPSLPAPYSSPLTSRSWRHRRLADPRAVSPGPQQHDGHQGSAWRSARAEPATANTLPLQGCS